MSTEKDIFKAGSTTYYWSSKFFTKGVRDDVFKLYSFVRYVDDLVDATPQKVTEFDQVRSRWNEYKTTLAQKTVPSIKKRTVQDIALLNMCYIVHRYDCDAVWVDAFLDSMQMDIEGRQYKTLDDTLEYIYGSAEVIGLFMSKLMQLPIAPYEYAKLQGRAMQWINFIRDINEDNELGRCYFPKTVLQKYGLADLRQETVQQQPDDFHTFIKEQLELYVQWQTEAYKGFSYIPKRLRIPLKTAVDMYNWTAEQIEKNPMIVYERKVKPSKQQVVAAAAKNVINA